MYNWTHEQAVSYEVARETIGHMIAIKSGEINEIEKQTHNSIELSKLNDEIAFLANERSNLEVTDEVAFKRIRESYGAIIKQRYSQNV